MTDQKRTGKVGYCKYLGGLITNDAICTRKIKSRFAMAVAAFSKKILFTSKIDLNLRKNVVKFFICIIAVCVTETWTWVSGSEIPGRF
jgi:hypothetical protein